LKVITELLKRFRIELLDAQPVLLCPLREAVYTTNEAQDTAWLIPTLLEPENEGIEMGTCGARTVSLSGEGPFYIGFSMLLSFTEDPEGRQHYGT